MFKSMNMTKLEASINAIRQPSVKHGAVTQRVATAFPLNEEQQDAVSAMVDFINRGPKDENLFFVLEGQAGVGKTFCIKDLINRLRGRMVFTAPTNKATKVLRESVTTSDYKPECRTIYSLLGLRLEANGEVKELTTPEEPLDLTKFLAVVVDEGSMINSKVLNYIKQTARDQRIQFIFMGDPAQLPPVGEIASPIWKIENKFILKKVMRHDNQILKLATDIRKKLSHPAPSVSIVSDFDGAGGVWSVTGRDFIDSIKAYARAGEFSRPDGAKAIAWRNVRVDELNRIIRAEIFDSVLGRWAESDRLIMLEPAKDLEGDTVAHTDDEGTVTRVSVQWHPTYSEFKCYAVNVTFDDNHAGTVWLLHEDSEKQYEEEVNRRAHDCRITKQWKAFWSFKEAFHKARYAYAITAHRSQGSTYEITFVDYRDILLNRTRREAIQCLYVALTRAKLRVIAA